MINQVLSISQMQELKELGIDISKAWLAFDSTGIITNISEAKRGGEFFVTFTLQDMISIIPPIIKTKVEDFYIRYNSCMCWYQDSFADAVLGPKEAREWNIPLLQSVFLMLKWCKQNNYI